MDISPCCLQELPRPFIALRATRSESMINDVRSAQLVQAAQIALAITKLVELANDLFVAFCVHGHPVYHGQGRHRLRCPASGRPGYAGRTLLGSTPFVL